MTGLDLPAELLQLTHYISIDPGTNTGYALFTAEGKPIWYQKIRGNDEFLDFLESITFKVAIIETYRNRGNQHDKWSQMPVAQHIGAIKRVCRKKGAEIVEQEPSPGLAIGLRFIGKHEEYVGKHVPDEISALAHGTYYLRKNKIV